MGVLLQYSSLTEEQKDLIMNDKTGLILKPVDPAMEGMKMNPKFAGRFKFIKEDDEKTIKLYEVDLINDTIRLPYNFACCLMQKIYNEDNHKKLITEKFAGELRPHQIPIVNEAFEYLDQYNTVTIGVPPATGKTNMSIYIALELGLVMMIVLPSKVLIKSWINTLETRAPGLSNNIWIVGENDKNFFNRKGEWFKAPLIIICMKDRISKIPDAVKDTVGTLIIDEAHMLCTKTGISSLLCCQSKYTIMLSATLERPDQQHRMVQRVVGEHGIFQVSIKPYLFIKLNTGIKVEEKFNDKGLFKDCINFGALLKNLTESEERNKIFVDIVKSNPQEKFILLSKLVEHITTLETMMADEGLVCDSLKSDKETYENSPLLLGSVKKMGVGFDESNYIEDLDYPSNVVIFGTSVKSHSSYEQFRGRGMRRENPMIIWPVDNHQTIRNHTKFIEKLVKQTNGTIIEIDYTPGCLILDNLRTPEQRRIFLEEISKSKKQKPTKSRYDQKDDDQGTSVSQDNHCGSFVKGVTKSRFTQNDESILNTKTNNIDELIGKINTLNINDANSFSENKSKNMNIRNIKITEATNIQNDTTELNTSNFQNINKDVNNTQSTNSVNTTKSSSPADITKSSSPADITKSSSPADTTKSSSPADITKSSSPADITKSSSPADIKKSSSPADITKSSSPADITKSRYPDDTALCNTNNLNRINVNNKNESDKVNMNIKSESVNKLLGCENKLQKLKSDYQNMQNATQRPVQNVKQSTTQNVKQSTTQSMHNVTQPANKNIVKQDVKSNTLKPIDVEKLKKLMK